MCCCYQSCFGSVVAGVLLHVGDAGGHGVAPEFVVLCVCRGVVPEYVVVHVVAGTLMVFALVLLVLVLRLALEQQHSRR